MCYVCTDERVWFKTVNSVSAFSFVIWHWWHSVVVKSLLAHLAITFRFIFAFIILSLIFSISFTSMFSIFSYIVIRTTRSFIICLEIDNPLNANTYCLLVDFGVSVLNSLYGLFIFKIHTNRHQRQRTYYKIKCKYSSLVSKEKLENVAPAPFV